LPNLTVAMSGAGSSDPDGDALTFAWTFGDGTSASGQAVSHVYANAGTFTVRLIVTDVRGLADTAFTTAVIVTPQQGIAEAQHELMQLVAAGGLSASDGAWHVNKLDNAVKLLDQATTTAAVNQLEEVLRKLDRAGMTSSDYAESVREVIQSLTS
jgi:PKD repeat protein